VAHNGAGYDEGPEGRHWVFFDSLQDRHVVLGVLSQNGRRLVIGSLCLLVEDNIVLDRLRTRGGLLLEGWIHSGHFLIPRNRTRRGRKMVYVREEEGKGG